MSLLKRRSRFAYPTTIEESTLVLREVSSTYTLTIPAGDYWPYFGTEYGSRTGLFNEIITQIVASAAAGTYAFEASVPSVSVGEGDIRRGISMQRTSGSGSWGIDWSSSTLDPRLLGWPDGHSTDVATTLEFLIPPGEVLGAWVPFRYRRMDPRNPRRLLAASKGEVADANFHQTDYGKKDDRAFVFAHQPAASVRKGKGSTYLGVANLDNDNGCFERFWEAASQRKEIIAFHEMDPVTIDADDSPVYEILKLIDNAEEFESNLRMMNTGGEFYEIEMLFGIVSGNRDD